MSIYRSNREFVLNKIYRKYKLHGENYSTDPTMHKIYCREAVYMAQQKRGLKATHHEGKHVNAVGKFYAYNLRKKKKR